MNQEPYSVEYAGAQTSLIATHKVLRNTYMLLSMTILFSAAMTVLAMTMGVRSLPYPLLFIGCLGLPMLVRATANSGFGIVSLFLFTGFMGYIMAPIMTRYLTVIPNGAQVIAMSLGATGATFFALSAYVLTTRKDFSFLRGFIIAGFFIILATWVAGFFLSLSFLGIAFSCFISLLSCAGILYQTSAIIHNGETNYIRATLALYINIINLFLSLLNIFSNNR